MNIRIAIFEDNKLMREAYEAILNGTNGFYCTGSYADCSDLQYKIQRSNPDVVLMDIEMPGIDGIEATRMLAASHPAVRILIQTVFQDDNRIFAAVCAGASGYILKTTTPAQLVQAVEEVYGGGSPMTPLVASKVLRLFQQFAPKTAPEAGDDEAQLTEREREILALMVKGNNPRQIGEALFLSYETIRTYIKKIYKKLHVASAAGAVAKAIHDRIV